MELTLNIPEPLVFRLRPHQARLAKILELGLDALEAAEGFTAGTIPDGFDGPMDRTDSETALWSDAAEALAPHWQEATPLKPLSSDVLRAYGRGQLDEDEAEAVRRQLMLQPRALEELLVMPDPPLAEASGEPPLEISDEDVRQAWRQLQTRQAGRGTEPSTTALEETVHETLPAAGPGVDDTPVPSGLAVPRRQRRPGLGASSRRWLALAAGLLLTSGGFAATQRYIEQQTSAPKLSSGLLLDVSRGARPYAVDPRADHVLLLLQVEPDLLAGHRSLRLELLDQLNGRVIYRQSLDNIESGGSTLHLRVPRDKLPVGSYELRMVVGKGRGTIIEPTVSFALRESPAGTG